jgi:hypothetical protein
MEGARAPFKSISVTHSLILSQRAGVDEGGGPPAALLKVRHQASQAVAVGHGGVAQSAKPPLQLPWDSGEEW